MQIATLKTVAASFVFGFLIFGFSQVMAQELPTEQTTVSEPQLRAFAKVYVEVEKIRQQYEPRLKEAKDPTQSREIEKDAVSKVQEALTKEGLTEETYGQIFEIARADEGFRKRLIQLINEERQKS
jgi:hypothetical protein